MKRGGFIFLFGLIAAAMAYGCIYFVCTSPVRNMQQSSKPELAWLQQEFQLTDSQLAQVTELHNAYAPKCDEMCHSISAKNAKLQSLLAATNVVTPEIKQAIAEAAVIRAECETAMLDHFYKVAQTMPLEQGRRYLEWVQQEIVKPSKMMPGKTHSADSMP